MCAGSGRRGGSAAADQRPVGGRGNSESFPVLTLRPRTRRGWTGQCVGVWVCGCVCVCVWVFGCVWVRPTPRSRALMLTPLMWWRSWLIASVWTRMGLPQVSHALARPSSLSLSLSLSLSASTPALVTTPNLRRPMGWWQGLSSRVSRASTT